MRGVGGGEHLGPGRSDLLGAAVVDIGGDQQPDARMMVGGVVPAEELLAEGAGVLDRTESVGEGGAVLEGLELALAVGLSLLMCGRECDLVTPRSARSWATCLEAIEGPRSAWMASWSRVMCCLVMVWSSSRSASAADSRSATIQPGT